MKRAFHAKSQLESRGHHPETCSAGDQEWDADLSNHPDASPLHRSIYCYIRSSPRHPCYSHHWCCKHCTWPGGTVGGRDSECTCASRLLLSLCIRSATHRHRNKTPSPPGWKEKPLAAHWKEWLFVEPPPTVSPPFGLLLLPVWILLCDVGWPNSLDPQVLGWKVCATTPVLE